MKKEEKIYVGKIIGTFGIKGELKVYTESDFVTYRFRKDATIYLINKKEEVEAKVCSMRFHKNTLLITINQCFDINLVEKYVGYEIYAKKDDEPTLDEDEYQLDDLINCEVYSEDAVYQGLVSDFIEVPQGYIMEVVDNGKKQLIPFVDEYILDIQENKIIIKVIELCQ